MQQLGRPDAGEVSSLQAHQEANVSVSEDRRSDSGLISRATSSLFRFSSSFGSGESKPKSAPQSESKPSAVEASEASAAPSAVTDDADLKGEVVISSPIHSDGSAPGVAEAKSSSGSPEAPSETSDAVNIENVMSTNYW